MSYIFKQRNHKQGRGRSRLSKRTTGRTSRKEVSKIKICEPCTLL
jgi:hypothetical protein